MGDRECENILRRFYGIEMLKGQRSQTQHRLKRLDFWQIPSGARVLEIGCGQGDTLAALSFAGRGFVHGVDIAPAAKITPLSAYCLCAEREET